MAGGTGEGRRPSALQNRPGLIRDRPTQQVRSAPKRSGMPRTRTSSDEEVATPQFPSVSPTSLQETEIVPVQVGGHCGFVSDPRRRLAAAEGNREVRGLHRSAPKRSGMPRARTSSNGRHTDFPSVGPTSLQETEIAPVQADERKTGERPGVTAGSLLRRRRRPLKATAKVRGNSTRSAEPSRD